MATPDGRTVLMLSDTIWELHGDAIRSIDPSIEPLVYSEDVPFPDDVLETVDIAFFSADCWPGRSRGIVVSILKAPTCVGCRHSPPASTAPSSST